MDEHSVDNREVASSSLAVGTISRHVSVNELDITDILFAARPELLGVSPCGVNSLVISLATGFYGIHFSSGDSISGNASDCDSGVAVSITAPPDHFHALIVQWKRIGGFYPLDRGSSPRGSTIS